MFGINNYRNRKKLEIDIEMQEYRTELLRGTNWGITDEMRNAKYSVIMTPELKKIIDERLLEQENAPKRKYTPKRITSKK